MFQLNGISRMYYENSSLSTPLCIFFDWLCNSQIQVEGQVEVEVEETPNIKYRELTISIPKYLETIIEEE